jgi:Radical SAM superfamily
VSCRQCTPKRATIRQRRVVSSEFSPEGEKRRAVRSAPPLFAELGAIDGWALSTYSGCDIACTYCIVNAQGRSVPRYPAGEVAERLRCELDDFADPPRLCFGAYNDAYPSVEPHYRVTRAALEVLVERGLEFTVVTKGAGVVLDTDLFQSHRRGHLQISLCSLDERAIAEIDPGAPTANERLAVIQHMVDAGVRVLLQISPWIPGITDVDLLLAQRDPTVAVQITPLRLPSYLRNTPLGRAFSQAEVNDAFQREYERVGSRPNVLWSRPPALDGSPPHIDHNLGSHEPSDWTRAPASPRAGADPVAPRRRARGVRLDLLRRHPIRD